MLASKKWLGKGVEKDQAYEQAETALATIRNVFRLLKEFKMADDAIKAHNSQPSGN